MRCWRDGYTLAPSIQKPASQYTFGGNNVLLLLLLLEVMSVTLMALVTVMKKSKSYLT